MAVYIDQQQVTMRRPNNMIGEALDQLFKDAAAFGFVGSGYVFWPHHASQVSAFLPSPRLGLHHGYSRAPWAKWFNEYLEHVCQGEPVYQACRLTTMPVWWGVDQRSRPASALVYDYPSEARDQFARCLQYTGIGDGFAVPIRGVNGGFGYISFLADKTFTEDTEAFSARVEALFNLSYGFYNRAIAYLDPVIEDAPQLSRRERQCLSLAAHGLTLDETGRELKIARSTVRYHMENAIMKLGVEKRVQAVAKAIALGLLEPLH
ncbi:MAG: LuxR C-terminal-related transcriptional regulator [Pseudomonadota bacterium]